MRRLVEFTGDGVYRYTYTTGSILFANRGFMDILELDGEPETIVGERVGGLITYLVKEGLVREILAQQGEIRNFEYHFKTRKGNDRWVLHNSFLRFDEEADDVVVEAIVRDITPVKKASLEAVEREKEWLAVTLASIGDAVIASDCQGRVLFLNRVAQQLTAWREEEALGRPLREVFSTVDEEQRLPQEDPVSKVLRLGRVVDFANHSLLLSKDGKEYPIADSGAPIYDRENRIIGVVLVFRDVTDERRYQDERIRGERLESLGLLAGGIAHDFNNLLTGILGNVSMARIRAQRGQKGLERYMEEAEKAANRAKELAQQLLTFAKGGTPVKRIVDLRPVITEAAEFALHGSNCCAQFYFEPDLLAAEVDPAQIGQVIQNLVLNAQQAMPAGGTVEIAARNRTKEKAGYNFVELSVSDQGTGIPEKYRQRIFDPYFTTKQKGSGIGLTTSYSIVQQHRGTLSVSSVVGEGSIFRVMLPAVSAAVIEAKPKTPGTALEKGAGRILVMDDEEVILELAKEILEAAGYEIETALNGESALECWRKAQERGAGFDLVVLDLTIAGGAGGKDVVKKIRQITPNARAIASSGYCNDPVISDYSSFEFCGVLPKPYSAGEMLRVVSAAIGGDANSENKCSRPNAE